MVSSTAASGCLAEKAASGVAEYFKRFSSNGSRIKSKSLFFIPDSSVAALTDSHPKNSRSLKDKNPATCLLETHCIVRKQEQSELLHNEETLMTEQPWQRNIYRKGISNSRVGRNCRVVISSVRKRDKEVAVVFFHKLVIGSIEQ